MGQMKRRVLLIDDDPALLKVVGKRLEVAGYELLTAKDGEEGLTKAQLGAPDVIIVDLVLPKKSGFEICAALKKDSRFQRIPILVFTGKGQEMDERLCREIGADGYLSKPHDAKALIEQIEALLANVLSAPPSA